jgi:hypothetical protein
VVGIHLVVGNAAGFDDHESVVARDAAGVAKGVEHQSATNQFEIGFENFFTETREKHSVLPRQPNKTIE